MGYTHYWRIHQRMNPELFANFSSDCEKLVKASDVPITGGSGEEGEEPEFSTKLVNFNGINDDAHETFYVKVNDSGFNFCKTARKPYDKVVTACLILLKHYFNFIEVSSDGDLDEWKYGIELFKSVFPDRTISLSLRN